MTTPRLVLKLAGAALALAAAGVVIVGLWGQQAPLDLDVWALLIAAMCGGGSAVLFIAADDLDTAQPEPRRPA